MNQYKHLRFIATTVVFILGCHGLVVKRGNNSVVIPDYVQPLYFYADSVLGCYSACKDNPACLQFAYTNKLCQFYYGVLIRELGFYRPGFAASNVDIRECPNISPMGFNCSLHQPTNTCYCYYNVKSLRWDDALSTCVRYGLKFASVNSQSQFDFVSKFLASLNVPCAWTSGIQKLDPVTYAPIGFQWKSTRQEVNLSAIGPWCPWQPNWLGSCIVFSQRNGAYCWDDNYCSAEFNPLCQFQLYGH